MQAGNHLIQGILNTFNGIQYVAPSQIFVSLSFSDPSKDGSTISEPNYSGFSRVAMQCSTPAPMGGGMGVQNENQITFAKAPTDQGTATFATLHDSIVGGNMLAFRKLNTEKSIRAESSPTLLPGESRWWWSGNMSTDFMTQLLNLFRGVSINAQEAWATLFNGSPESGGSELVGGGFSREKVIFTNPVRQPSGQFTISNAETVSFASPITSLGPFDTDAIMDAPTSGRVLLWRTGPQDVYAAGDKVNYIAGDLLFSLN